MGSGTIIVAAIKRAIFACGFLGVTRIVTDGSYRPIYMFPLCNSCCSHFSASSRSLFRNAKSNRWTNRSIMKLRHIQRSNGNSDVLIQIDPRNTLLVMNLLWSSTSSKTERSHTKTDKPKYASAQGKPCSKSSVIRELNTSSFLRPQRVETAVVTKCYANTMCFSSFVKYTKCSYYAMQVSLYRSCLCLLLLPHKRESCIVMHIPPQRDNTIPPTLSETKLFPGVVVSLINGALTTIHRNFLYDLSSDIVTTVLYTPCVSYLVTGQIWAAARLNLSSYCCIRLTVIASCANESGRHDSVSTDIQVCVQLANTIKGRCLSVVDRD